MGHNGRLGSMMEDGGAPWCGEILVRVLGYGLRRVRRVQPMVGVDFIGAGHEQGTAVADRGTGYERGHGLGAADSQPRSRTWRHMV